MKPKIILPVFVAGANLMAGIHYAHAITTDLANAADPGMVAYAGTATSGPAYTITMDVNACEPIPIRLEVPRGWSIEIKH